MHNWSVEDPVTLKSPAFSHFPDVPQGLQRLEAVSRLGQMEGRGPINNWQKVRLKDQVGWILGGPDAR